VIQTISTLAAAEAHVAAPQPLAALEERLDGHDVRTTDRLRIQWRPFDRPRVRLGRREQRDRAPLHDEGERRPAKEHHGKRDRERDQRRRVLAHGREDLRDDLTHVAGQQLVSIRAEEQDDEEDAADNRDGEQDFQGGLCDELHGDKRPVGGGDERAALQRELERGGKRHGDNSMVRPILPNPQFTMAVCVSLPPTPRFRSCPGGRSPGLPPAD